MDDGTDNHHTIMTKGQTLLLANYLFEVSGKYRPAPRLAGALIGRLNAVLPQQYSLHSRPARTMLSEPFTFADF